MSPFSRLSNYPEFMGEREHRTVDKRQRVADRIAGRILSGVHAERFVGVVKGGRLGLTRTYHEPETYALVAERLLEDKVEINVHGISQAAADSKLGVDPLLLVHVVSVATLKGWPKHLPLTPTQNPEAFATLSVAINHVGPYKVEQIYPPQQTASL